MRFAHRLAVLGAAPRIDEAPPHVIEVSHMHLNLAHNSLLSRATSARKSSTSFSTLTCLTGLWRIAIAKVRQTPSPKFL